MMRNNKAPMLNMAGRDIMRAKRSLRMPLAALMRRRTLPILKTLMIRRSVGVTNIPERRSSSKMPEIEDSRYLLMKNVFYYKGN